MTAKYGQLNGPGFVPKQLGQTPTYENAPSYLGTPPSSGYGLPYMSLPVMQLPTEIQPTSEKTVLASSCSKAQLLYKEIIAKEKEYDKWKEHYVEHGLLGETAHRSSRLQIEGGFLALAQRAQRLHKEKARGAEYLRERICDIMADIARTIREDLTFLEKCLDDAGKQSESASCLKSEYSSLATRVEQFASMERTFERSSFTMSSGKRCFLPVSDSSINLSYKLQGIERKLPDSEFVQGVKSFAKGVKGFFSPSPSSQSAYILTRYSDSLREKDKNLGAWVTMNRLQDGYMRQLNIARHGHPWQ